MGGPTNGRELRRFCALIIAWFQPGVVSPRAHLFRHIRESAVAVEPELPARRMGVPQRLIPHSGASISALWLEVGDRDLFNPNAMARQTCTTGCLRMSAWPGSWPTKALSFPVCLCPQRSPRRSRCARAKRCPKRLSTFAGLPSRGRIPCEREAIIELLPGCSRTAGQNHAPSNCAISSLPLSSEPGQMYAQLLSECGETAASPQLRRRRPSCSSVCRSRPRRADLLFRGRRSGLCCFCLIGFRRRDPDGQLTRSRCRRALGPPSMTNRRSQRYGLFESYKVKFRRFLAALRDSGASAPQDSLVVAPDVTP